MFLQTNESSLKVGVFLVFLCAVIIEKLTITLHPECYVQLLEGESLRLNCEAVGFPYPVFTWFLGEDKMLSMGSSGILEVNNVRFVMQVFK